MLIRTESIADKCQQCQSELLNEQKTEKKMDGSLRKKNNRSSIPTIEESNEQ